MFTKRLSSRAKQAREREGGGETPRHKDDGVSEPLPSNVVRTPPLKPFTQSGTPVAGMDRPSPSHAPTRPGEGPRRPFPGPTPRASGAAHQAPGRPLPSRPAAILAQPAVARPVNAAGGPSTPPRPATWPITRPSAAPGPSQSTPQGLGRVLAVGRDIRLTGEIKSCDTLTIEGSVEGDLSETRHLEIGQGGRFNGTAEVESAVIGGAFEGDLTVRGLLTLKGTGRVSGSIRYGEIEIERGGRISGTFGLMGGSDAARAGDGGETIALSGPRPA